jgi:hypothetical protein
MRSSHGYGLGANKQRREPRPTGVAILAVVGVAGSLLTIMYSLVKIIGLSGGGGVAPSRQLAVLGLALVVALVTLWINWGFWEMIRWAWWGNLAISLLTTAALLGGLRYVPELADVIAPLWGAAEPARLTSSVLAAIVVGLVYHLIAIIYMVGVHAIFKVGVKDERPLWERVQRR